jgi:phosphoadenosine phosphosulfate reductase
MPLDHIAADRNAAHRDADAETLLRDALNDGSIGPIALVSSFGAESVVLLHMIAQINKGTPVIFLDTEMLFPETLAYQREVSTNLGLTDIRIVTPDRNQVLTEDVDGILHLADTDTCCDLRKTRPLEKALAGFGGWITGRKQFQNGQRAQLPLYERDGPRIKINPLAGWNAQDLKAYMEKHALPRHPLVAQGYPSIGCMPCTTRVSAHEDPRAGRWRGTAKTECGIHFGANGRVQREERAA